MKKGRRYAVLGLVLVLTLTLASTTDAGGPVGSGRFLIHNDAGVTEEAAKLAYNTQQQEYLVVWKDTEIWGRRVTADDALVGPDFRISPVGEGASPDVAYNIATNEYLVVWETAASVRGQRLSALGTLEGGVITIAAGNYPPPGFDGWYYDQPAVAYASTSERYLVTFRYRADSDNGSSILAKSILSDGTPEQINPFTLAQHSNVLLPEAPAVAYNRSRNEFLVAWQQTVGPDIDVYGRRVKMSGGADVLGGDFYIGTAASQDETAPAVAAIPTVPDEGQYLVAWERDVGGNRNIVAAAVAWDGTVGIPQALAATPWGEYRPAAAGSEAHDQFLVTWTWIPVPGTQPMMEVQARTLALDGTVLHDTVDVGGGQVFDSAVAAGSGGDFLVAFDDNETLGTTSRGIYGRRWANAAPVADAGPDQWVGTGAAVTLDGSGSSDPDGDLPLSYLWTQTGVFTVTLSDPTIVNPTFTAPSTPITLTFELVVTDALGLADPTPDIVVIVVAHRIYMPLALKGP
jgi:hypothetical protein